MRLTAAGPKVSDGFRQRLVANQTSLHGKLNRKLSNWFAVWQPWAAHLHLQLILTRLGCAEHCASHTIATHNQLCWIVSVLLLERERGQFETSAGRRSPDVAA